VDIRVQPTVADVPVISNGAETISFVGNSDSDGLIFNIERNDAQALEHSLYQIGFDLRYYKAD
jgi:hypothetical protein